MSTRQKNTTAKRGVARGLQLWLIDVGLFVIFLMVMNVPLTGITIHEWLSIGIATVLVVHLVQHGNWVATITGRLLSATSFKNRLNSVMMVVLFLAFVSIIVSGLVISEVALPWLGVRTAYSSFWLWLHLLSVDVVLYSTALHLALHWKWITGRYNRYVTQPLQARSARRQPLLVDPAKENA